MAVETPTQTTGDGRALSAALSAPAPFAGRTASMALHASDRHVDRWAPEDNATSRSRSLGTLSFVDRLLGPWLGGVAAAPRSPAGASNPEGRLPSVSWVFPRPWYQDELDWVAAAREGGEQARAGLLTTRGSYVAPASPRAAMPSGAIAASVRSAGQTVVAVSESGAQPLTRRSLQSELAYVAPSFGASAMTYLPEGEVAVAPTRTFASPAGISVAAPVGAAAGAPSGGSARVPAYASAQVSAQVSAMAPAALGAAMAQHRALRAWSPQVTFAAAQAAEVMSGVVGGVERAAIATSGTAAASHSPILEGLSYVAPAELAAFAPRAGSAPSTPAVAQASSTAPIARAIAQLAAAQAVASGRASSQPSQSSAETVRAAIAETAAPVRPSATPSAEPSPAVIAYRAEQARVVEELARREAAPAPSAAAPSSFEQLVSLASSSPASAQAMRAVELMARSSLTGTVAPVSGPRVALPAGLGGAVIGHDAAVAAHRPMVTMTPAMPTAFGDTTPVMFDAHGAPIAPTMAAAPRAVPTFQPVWTAPFAPSSIAPAPSAGPETFRGRPGILGSLQAAHAMPTAALSAIAGDRPAAVDHLAWTDRWLARFAGASPTSLAAVDVASERSTAVPRALAAGAPEVVFVIPGLDEIAAPARAAAAPARPSLTVAPAPRATPQRFSDDEPVPDEVLAAIVTASRPRMPTPMAPASGATAGAPTLVPAATPQAVRPTMADQIARSAPTAPDAGLYAGLASSPMAPALAGVMPLPAAPVFDPRALYAGGVISAYLGGAIARVGAPTPSAMTMWPATASAPWASPWIDAALPPSAESPTLSVAARAPSTPFVSPDSTSADAPRLATRPDQNADGPIAARPAPVSMPAAAPTAAAPTAAAPSQVPAWIAAAAAAADPTIWSLRAESAPAASGITPGLGASGAALDAPLGDVDATGWTARPGMTAELAHGFSVHTERAAADLSYDFVSPEQVLAARVYGFGPIEAAQAARLAVSGPAGLAAMASAIDLTFLRQLHIESERSSPSTPTQSQTLDAAPARARRDAPAMIVPAFDASSDASVASEQPRAAAAEAQAADVRAAEVRAASQRSAPQAAIAAPPPVFGVGRRLPRGVFMWPPGAVAALDLRADLPEGTAAMQVAALELLAANAVAEMGALVVPHFGHDQDASDAPAVAPGVRAARALPSSFAASEAAAPAASSMPSMPSMPGAADPSFASEPAVEQVAAAMAVPSSQRARFESIYLSMSRSPTGQSMSPSVRAARALAIAAHQGRDDVSSTAQERAFAAWSVMPMVYSTPEPSAAGGSYAAETAGTPSEPTGASRYAPAMDVYAPDAATDDRPGLGGLAARAGQALGSYVRPSGHEVDRASSGAAYAASAPDTSRAREPFVHELIRQGRGFTRAGGGEVEIPGWFEAAAKRMLEQRGLGENLSLAELTLVASAPSTQIAASKRTASSATPAAESPATPDKGEKPDIQKMANEIYNEIRTLLDIARERSGDPWS